MSDRLPLLALAGWLIIALGWVSVRSGAEEEEDLAAELPRIPAVEPSEALGTFAVPEGFQLVLAVAEPLVTDPVAAVFDADGRLYVVEMRNYPFPQDEPAGRIRLLEDTTGDGRFDASTIFLDNLHWPTGIVAYDGGVFIAAAPDILYAKDTTGDGRADQTRAAFTGFGTENVQALLNGLLWGPDGWIYGVAAGNGGEIRNLARPDDPPVSVRGRDFRFRPDGSAFEATAGGGQYGHSFDDWGHRFTCSNSNHIRQVVVPLRYIERNPALAGVSTTADIAVDGAAAPVYRISPAEPWRIVRTRQRAADPEMVKRLPPTELFVTGFFTSASGVTIYRGTAYPEAFQGNAFVGDVGGNLLHRKRLSVAGARYQAERPPEEQTSEFLAATDNWFRPVISVNTPDGTLLILDMYRETIEHPWSIPEPIMKHLDMMSGHDRGRLYHLIPEGFRKRDRPALSRKTTEELVGVLSDPDAWWRETAQRLLIERNDPEAIAPLRTLAKRRPSALAQVHALWTLDVLGGLRDEDVLPALSDPEPRVREQAARLTEGRVSHSLALREGLLALAADSDPMVRFQAALSLGEVQGSEADSDAIAALATIAAQDAADPWTRTAILTAVGGRVGALIQRLAADHPGLLNQAGGRILLDELATLVGAEGQPEAIAALLEHFTRGESEADLELARAVVLGLGRGLGRSGSSLREALDYLRDETVMRGLERLFESSARLARDGDAPPPRRVEAIRLMGQGAVEPALEILPELLDASQPVAVQLAALRALGDQRDERVGPAITARWRSLSPTVRREAAEVLFGRPERLNALLAALEAGAIVAADLDPSRLQQLRDHGDASVRQRAEQALGQLERPERGPLLEQYREALALDGDPDRGRLVYENACATCHQVEGQGIAVGPDLATVASRTAEDLLVHILDPNREVAPNYVNYTIATVDGQIFTGMIADETAQAVTLMRAEGATDVVLRERIEAIVSTGLSLMPEGMEQDIDVQEMADLIAFLRGLGQSGN